MAGGARGNSHGGDDHFFLNLYVETLVENRPEGLRLDLRYTHHL